MCIFYYHYFVSTQKTLSSYMSSPQYDIIPAVDFEIEEFSEEDKALLALIEQQEREELEQQEVIKSKESLPVYAYKEQLLSLINNNQVVIVVGATGSGKTTQIPQFASHAGYRVACTQPRRVAATSVATRVAQEMGSELGGLVGYSVRFDERTSDKTRVKFITDGILLRDLSRDPLLSQYDCLMIDEAHERSLATDLALGLIKDVLTQRPNFKLIVASATMDSTRFSDYFNKAPVCEIPGKLFHVDVYYSKEPVEDYVSGAVSSVIQIHKTQPKGDILVFMTGQREIETICEELERMDGLMVCGLYAQQDPKLQQMAFESPPEDTRKVVVATNVAETSLTIDGIVYVIDSGRYKQNVYQPKTGLESLLVGMCSQASAKQRTGRAGRTQPGKCFRLYTNEQFNSMPKSNLPEIMRVDLANVVLSMFAMGVTNLIKFDFIDAPNTRSMIRALNELYELGALNEKGQLTKLGYRMSLLPLDFKLARALVGSFDLGCINETLTVVSCMEEAGSIWLDKQCPEIFKSKIGGDQITMLNIYNGWRDSRYNSRWCRDHGINIKAMQRVKRIRSQLERIVKDQGIDFGSDISPTVSDLLVINTMKAICMGFKGNVAMLNGDHYIMKDGQECWLHPGSVMIDVVPPVKRVVFIQALKTSREYLVGVMPATSVV